MEIFRKAGLPDGVINMVFGDPEMITNTVLESPDFAGIHYTGSTEVFRGIWGKIGLKLNVIAPTPELLVKQVVKILSLHILHPKPKEVATGIIRGAFEFQGQKCSAASRVYLPKSIADEVIENFCKTDLKTIKMGSPEDFENFVTAVIHKGAFDRLANAIEQVKKDQKAEIVAGGIMMIAKVILFNLQ